MRVSIRSVGGSFLPLLATDYQDGLGLGPPNESQPQPFRLAESNRAVFQKRTATKIAPPAAAACQESVFSARPELSSSFEKRKNASAFTSTVITNPKKMVIGDSGLDILGHDLVHALPRKAERVSDLRQGLPAKTCLPNVLISGFLAAGPRPERPPLPTGKHLQRANPFRRKLAFTEPLTGVIHPIAQTELFAVKKFHMNSRDYAMPFSEPELIKCTNVQKESLIMIHAVYNSGENLYMQPEFNVTVVESNG